MRLQQDQCVIVQVEESHCEKSLFNVDPLLFPECPEVLIVIFHISS
jgi:hypothetical protein